MRRLLRVLTGGVLWLGLSSGTVSAQYISFHSPDDEGNPTAVSYAGEASWLVDQKDEKSQLHRFPALDVVHLIDHKITNDEIRYVAGLKWVSHLSIGNCPEAVEVEQGGLELLETMPSLEGLRLCIAGLGDKDLEFLPKISKLRVLDVGLADEPKDRAVLSDKAIDVISSIKTLEVVRITPEGTYSDSAIRKLAEMPNLFWLSINSSKLTDRSLETLGRKFALEQLSIDSPQFSDEGVLALGRLRSLEYLAVESPLLTARSLDVTKELNELEVLRLTSSGADEGDLQRLTHLDKLEVAYFGREPGSIRLRDATKAWIESRSPDSQKTGESSPDPIACPAIHN
jgi:hypothetical protein